MTDPGQFCRFMDALAARTSDDTLSEIVLRTYREVYHVQTVTEAETDHFHALLERMEALSRLMTDDRYWLDGVGKGGLPRYRLAEVLASTAVHRSAEGLAVFDHDEVFARLTAL